MPDVFISHATQDDAIVTRIHDVLSAAGLDVWVDHVDGLSPGDDFDDEIQKALNECSMGLFVLSPHSVKSKECNNEWRSIMALGKRLYVVLIGEIPNVDFPYRWRTTQYVKLEPDFDARMGELAAAMTGKRDLNPDAPATGQLPYLPNPLSPFMEKEGVRQAVDEMSGGMVAGSQTFYGPV
jgi:hypothetical protein